MKTVASAIAAVVLAAGVARADCPEGNGNLRRHYEREFGCEWTRSYASCRTQWGEKFHIASYVQADGQYAVARLDPCGADAPVCDSYYLRWLAWCPCTYEGPCRTQSVIYGFGEP